MKAALREMYFPIRNIQENLQILQEVRGKNGDLRKHKHSAFSGVGGQVVGLFLTDSKGDVQFQNEVLIVWNMNGDPGVLTGLRFGVPVNFL